MTPATRPIDSHRGEAPFPSDRRSEIDAHFQVAEFSVSAAVGAAALTTIVMGWAGALRVETALPWLFAMIVLGATHIGASQTYRRASSLRENWRFWALLTSAITLAEGLGWGLAPFAVARAGNQAALFLVMLVTLCVAAGSVIGYGRYLPTRVIAFVTPTAPYLVYSAFSEDRIVRGSFFLLLLFLVAIGRLGYTADQGFRREAAMRKRNARLALDLRRQKEVAERANVAKSKFLAAASHDLRQPIHALGLYVGALRNAALPPELLALTHKMEMATTAMDRLFAALLDISRLDAGVVKVHAETFRLDELIETLCDEYREEARGKGLTLTGEADGFFVRTDRVLFERILRNFIANAVRHTPRGGVRVRCKARGGAVAVQVWDSGPGIARQHLPLIFEEYFQVGNAERDREKGLGLGLAIVRRLAALIGAALAVRTRLGRGSCFEVRVDLGNARDVQIRAAPQEALVEPGQGLVVVIDDEAAVRDAMQSVLTAWGYQVLAAGSGEEALQRIEGGAGAPAMLLCDFRLRTGEDGLAVIARFRARWGALLPSVLITGDTAPERLAEADQSGIHLLHKPVTHEKLRAAVANLMRPAALAASGAQSLADGRRTREGV